METLDTIRPPRNLDYGTRQQWHDIIAGSGYWFTRDTMRFFQSRILWKTLTATRFGHAFISSEGCPEWGIARAYTVREYQAGNGVTTIGEQGGYRTRAAALAALRAFTTAQQ